MSRNFGNHCGDIMGISRSLIINRCDPFTLRVYASPLCFLLSKAKRRNENEKRERKKERKREKGGGGGAERGFRAIGRRPARVSLFFFDLRRPLSLLRLSFRFAPKRARERAREKEEGKEGAERDRPKVGIWRAAGSHCLGE